MGLVLLDGVVLFPGCEFEFEPEPLPFGDWPLPPLPPEFPDEIHSGLVWSVGLSPPGNGSGSLLPLVMKNIPDTTATNNKIGFSIIFSFYDKQEYCHRLAFGIKHWPPIGLHVAP